MTIIHYWVHYDLLCPPHIAHFFSSLSIYAVEKQQHIFHSPSKATQDKHPEIEQTTIGITKRTKTVIPKSIAR